MGTGERGELDQGDGRAAVAEDEIILEDDGGFGRHRQCHGVFDALGRKLVGGDPDRTAITTAIALPTTNRGTQAP